MCFEQWTGFLILRHSGDTFRLVGEYYVYGIMTGEAVQLVKGSGGVKVFNIN